LIISLILGGLGNQFFQYAAARQIALRQRVPLKLETRGFRFSKYAAHPYALDKFNVADERAHPFDYLRLAPRTILRRVLVRERPNGFNENLEHIQDDVILVGYWQDPRYFSGIGNVLRSEFTLRKPPSSRSAQIAEAIQGEESISIHIRRTDYVRNPRNVEIFEECPMDYYRDAMNLIAERCSNPHYFVFSDDPDWARANLRVNGRLMTFVTHNDTGAAHEDLMLMRQCRHNIIANSTFSWWGAWLNDNPQKIVVSPRKWFKNNRGQENDLLPSEWIRL
jgi:hypothetical protein